MTLDLNALADLTTATLDGNFASVDVQSCNNIETLTFKSTTDVNNGDIDIDGNSDLENLTLTGAKTSGVIINNNNSLVSVTVDAVYQKTLATDATLDGSIAVTANTDLETLTLVGENVSVLTVTGNVDLETINGTVLTSLGATAKSNNVTISGNKFSASIAQDKTNAAGCTSCGNLEANDLGSFTTTSGMGTMSTYLKLVAANTSATASVYFDTVESTTNATGVETTGETTGQNDTTVILALTAEVATAAKADIAATRAFILDVSANPAGTVGLELIGGAGVGLFSNGTSASTAGSVTMNTNLDLLIADLKSAANVARFDAYGITMDAARGGNSTGTVSLILYGSGSTTAAVNGQRYSTGDAMNAAVSATNHGVGEDDAITLTIGGNSATTSGTTPTTVGDLGDALVAAWAAKYGGSGTASASAIATITNTGGVLDITMLDKGTAGYAVDVDVSVAAGTATATNAATIDYMIGATKLESDDATVDTDVVVTVTSKTKGTISSEVGALGTTYTAAGVTNGTGILTSTSAGVAWIELFTTRLTNTTSFVEPEVANQESANPVNAEDGSPKVVTTAAQTKTRVHWL